METMKDKIDNLNKMLGNPTPENLRTLNSVIDRFAVEALLKVLFDKKIITKEEFNAKVLDEMKKFAEFQKENKEELETLFKPMVANYFG